MQKIVQAVAIAEQTESETKPELSLDTSRKLEVTNAAAAETIVSLKQQLAVLEKSSARNLKRYQMMKPLQPPPILGFNYNTGHLPEITEKTYEYLQIEPEKEQKLRQISKAFIDDLISWEKSATNNLQQVGSRIEMDIHPMSNTERDQRLHYREQLKSILNEEDFKLIDASLANAVRSVFQNRKISIEPTTENGIEYYNMEVFYFDHEGNSVGHSSMTTQSVPTRYAHLFENLENQ